MNYFEHRTNGDDKSFKIQIGKDAKIQTHHSANNVQESLSDIKKKWD